MPLDAGPPPHLDDFAQQKIKDAQEEGIAGLVSALRAPSEAVRTAAARMVCALVDSTTPGHEQARLEFLAANGISALIVRSNSVCAHPIHMYIHSITHVHTTSLMSRLPSSLCLTRPTLQQKSGLPDHCAMW